MDNIQTRDFRKDRRFIFFTLLALTLFGTLMIYESSSLTAYRTTGDAAYFFKKQFIFFIIGLVLFFLTLLINLDFLRKHSKELLLITIFILLVLLVVGKKSGGAKRWFHLFGLTLQPSEFLKIFFVVYCVDYIVKRKNLIKNFTTLLPLGIILGTISLIVLLQPDLGTAIFWILWSLLILYLYHARKKHLILTVCAGAVALFFLIATHPYRFRRITGYLNPFADPQDTGFQLIQSQIAYGQGW
ncbi:MAG: FtsW/RodA/SpoVE family cell cycle protein, partial [Candidatus Omnitrophota bacterium]